MRQPSFPRGLGPCWADQDRSARARGAAGTAAAAEAAAPSQTAAKASAAKPAGTSATAPFQNQAALLFNFELNDKFLLNKCRLRG